MSPPPSHVWTTMSTGGSVSAVWSMATMCPHQYHQQFLKWQCERSVLEIWEAEDYLEEGSHFIHQWRNTVSSHYITCTLISTGGYIRTNTLPVPRILLTPICLSVLLVGAVFLQTVGSTDQSGAPCWDLRSRVKEASVWKAMLTLLAN